MAIVELNKSVANLECAVLGIGVLQSKRHQEPNADHVPDFLTCLANHHGGLETMAQLLYAVTACNNCELCITGRLSLFY